MTSRRDALVSILGAPLAASLLANCDSQDELPPVEGELLGQSHEAGHRLRDPLAARFAGIEPERTRVLVAGGGPAGLSAAWRLRARGIEPILVELEPAIGGTARSGASRVTPYPWGAHYLPLPDWDQHDLLTLLEEMGALEGRGPDGDPIAREELLGRAPDERLFYRGFWYRGLFPRALATPEDRAERARFIAIVDRWIAWRDALGRRAFDLPVSRASDDAEVRALDRISASEWLSQNNLRSPRLRWWLEYGTRDDYGLSLEDASAWALLFYHAARVRSPGEEAAGFLTWPEGNGALVRHLARGARDVRTGWMVVSIRDAPIGEGEGGATVDLVETGSGRAHRVIAERVICALPRFVGARLIEGVDASDASYGAWMVANVHLRDRPAYRGAEPAWDNVLYDSPSLGYVSATHQRGRDFGPTVWTYYLPLTEEPRTARQRLLTHTWDDWRDAVLADLGRAHPGLRSHVERIDVWRWGHAMAQPRAGVFTSEARRRAREPIGRVHFAHSDLSGLALFEEAFDHGVRAADEVVAALLGQAT